MARIQTMRYCQFQSINYNYGSSDANDAYLVFDNRLSDSYKMDTKNLKCIEILEYQETMEDLAMTIVPVSSILFRHEETAIRYLHEYLGVCLDLPEKLYENDTVTNGTMVVKADIDLVDKTPLWNVRDYPILVQLTFPNYFMI